ncbi:MAG: 4Fe-4S dicluster domain-containing protein [Thermoflexales bacterium]|nr:4Fe-4S dicluster domain-containing protein [Thermoflexales bacterium]
MAKGRIEIDVDRCKGCELCMAVCPKNLIVPAEFFNVRGYHPAELVDPEEACTGCGLCALMCPDVVITVYRQTPVKATT